MSPIAHIDLSDAPIIDHHMHSLLKTDQPLDLRRYQGYFTSTFAVSSTLGPVLGGFFADYEDLAPR